VHVLLSCGEITHLFRSLITGTTVNRKIVREDTGIYYFLKVVRTRLRLCIATIMTYHTARCFSAVPFLVDVQGCQGRLA
jgi:hypothetical protein